MDDETQVWDPEDEGDEEEVTPVFDENTYRVRLMAQRCATCIFRPGNRMHLQPGRVKDMVETCIAKEGHVVCHDTLRHADTELPGAVCRGFEQHAQGAAHSLAVKWMHGTGLVTLVHADGRLEDADYRALPAYEEED